MQSDHYENCFRGETVLELHRMLLDATVKTIEANGANDPKIAAVVAAGFNMTFDSLEKYDPRIVRIIMEMLNAKYKKI